MRRTYRILAIAIVVLVGVQAAAIAWGDSSMGEYVMGGGVIDQSLFTDESGSVPFVGVYGFIVHGMSGTLLIPAVAIALLVISFFAKFPRATFWAVVVLVLVALQVTLGMLSHGLAILGAFHGLNALALAAAAFYAQLIAGRARKEPVRKVTSAAETPTAV